MAITAKQIAAAARASRHVCSRDGYGHQVLLWPDGSWSEAVSSNDVVCLLGSEGERTYPVARLCTPYTRAEVAALVEEHREEQERRVAEGAYREAEGRALLEAERKAWDSK